MERSRPYAARSWRLRSGCIALVCLTALVGCAETAMRSQSPEDIEREVGKVHLVGEFSVSFGLHPLMVQSVGLVTNLPNTGRDLPPSAARAMLIGEMQKRCVDSPNQLLASPMNSAVIVRAMLRPGIEKGDRVDIDVTLPEQCETTSLRDGVLLPARLREMAILEDHHVHEGSVMCIAEGPLETDPITNEQRDSKQAPHATIIEGGLSLLSRPLGLVVRPEQRPDELGKRIQLSSDIARAVNNRFFVQRHGIKTGVATAKTDRYIQLVVYPTYKDNVLRYFQVIGSLPLSETPAQRQLRLEVLEGQLLDGVTSAEAALRLEAIGKEGKSVLKKGIASNDPEVRFYAAEALAYLDDEAAAAPLTASARDEPAFRARAFAALSAMDDSEAYDQLATLLDVSSAETRYGAFRALWAMNPRDPLVRGEKLGDPFSFSLHELHSKGPSMVHVTRAYRPEVVIFGADPTLRAPLILNAGKNIIIRDIDGRRIAVSRFAPGVPDQRREIGNHVSELVRAIVDVGGSYPDVVQALAQAKTSGAMTCRFEVDAVPKTDREYVRHANVSDSGQTSGDNGSGSGAYPVDGPSPDLYPAESSHGDNQKASGSPVDSDK